MKIDIIATPEFKKYFNWYGYEEFTRKVLHKCPNKKQYGLIDNITLFDAEPSKRVFFRNEKNQEFIIRYFINTQNKEMWKASYTLYIDVDDGDGGYHGEPIYGGVATTHYQK